MTEIYYDPARYCPFCFNTLVCDFFRDYCKAKEEELMLDRFLGIWAWAQQTV